MIGKVNINEGYPEGVKFDQDKPRMDLLPPFPLMQVAMVLGHGAKKYADHNWRKGMDFSRPYAAALRHLCAWNDGEDIDPESGLNHIDHALCELMFLRQYIKDFPERDDRFKKKPVCSICKDKGFFIDIVDVGQFLCTEEKKVCDCRKR